MLVTRSILPLNSVSTFLLNLAAALRTVPHLYSPMCLRQLFGGMDDQAVFKVMDPHIRIERAVRTKAEGIGTTTDWERVNCQARNNIRIVPRRTSTITPVFLFTPYTAPWHLAHTQEHRLACSHSAGATWGSTPNKRFTTHATTHRKYFHDGKS